MLRRAAGTGIAAPSLTIRPAVILVKVGSTFNLATWLLVDPAPLMTLTVPILLMTLLNCKTMV